MLSELLKIRILELYRILKEVGLIRLLVLLLILSYFLSAVYKFLVQREYTNISLITAGALLLIIHMSRKDKQFLRIMAVNTYQIYLTEYFILVLPFTILWIINHNWPGLFVLFILCAFVPLINLNSGFLNIPSFILFLINPFKRDANFKMSLKLRFLHPSAFEWRSGIRRNLIIILPLYIIVLAFSYRPYVTSIGFILISIAITSFYNYGEPRELIEIYADTPSKFINRKIKYNWQYLSVMFLPVFLSALIFNPYTWYFLLGSYIISLIMQFFAIVIKYGIFEEHSELNRNSSILFLTGIFTLIPFFWPASVAMGIRYYNKARENLKPYFDAQN